MKTKIIFLIASFFMLNSNLYSQLECKVTLNTDNIQGGYRENLQNFASDIENYINSNKWSSDDFPQKIKCSMNIFFTTTSGENRYSAQVFIGSQRPIYFGKNPSDKNTILLRIFDDKWEFTYLKNQPIYKNENKFDPLMSFINFYVYLILGFDYDTYSQLSGTNYFQRAMSICNQASGSIGWDRSNSAYSKFSFAEEILNPKFNLFRQSQYIYHFKGLDLLATKPEKGFTNIISSLSKIDSLNYLIAGRSIVLKTYFDTKYLEFVDVFRNYPDKEIYLKLSKIDKSHKLIYDEAYKRLTKK